MAMAEIAAIAVERLSPDVLVWTDLGADGLKFRNTGKEIIMLRRDQADPSTVTIATYFTYDGLALADLTVALAAGDGTEQFKPVGPFPAHIYNQAGGWVHVTSTDADDMMVVLQMTAVD